MTAAARFRVVSQTAHAQILAAATDTDPAVRDVVLASSLLSHDLTATAVQVLDNAQPCRSPALAKARTVLLARALSRLEDVTRLRRIGL